MYINAVIDRVGFRSNILPSGWISFLSCPHCAGGEGSRKCRWTESRPLAVAYTASEVWTLLTTPASSSIHYVLGLSASFLFLNLLGWFHLLNLFVLLFLLPVAPLTARCTGPFPLV